MGWMGGADGHHADLMALPISQRGLVLAEVQQVRSWDQIFANANSVSSITFVLS
jgi:hypothetical protein